MPEQYKVVTKKGYGKRLGQSFGGMATGLLLFFASFGVLYWNEGRVDVSEVAVNAVEVSADSVDAAADGKQVYVSGAVASDEKLGDGLFLNQGDYLAVRRVVEMYAWTERSKSTSDTDLGGSETTETTYSYQTEWVETVPSTADFYVPEGHDNPAKLYESDDFYVGSARIGAYDLNFDKLQLPAFDKVTVNDITVAPGEGAEIRNGYVYVSYDSVDYFYENDSDTPQVGDVRISYMALKNPSDGTVFGKLDGGKIVTYVDLDDTGAKVYRFCDGGRDECLAQMHGEFKMMLWIFRLVGFLMMWFGLGALLGPISTLLDVVPFFGSLSRGLIGVVTLVVALVLSIVAIVVSMIIHNIVALIISVVVVLGVFFFIWKKKGKSPKASKT